MERRHVKCLKNVFPDTRYEDQYGIFIPLPEPFRRFNPITCNSFPMSLASPRAVLFTFYIGRIWAQSAARERNLFERERNLFLFREFIHNESLIGVLNFICPLFLDFLKAFQSVYQFPVILCYNVSCDFVSLIFSLIRVRNALWEDITQGKL